MSTQNVIEVDTLTKQFGSVTAIDGIDFAVRSGEVFGLLGPNGAGKSTTIDLLLGLTAPTEGQVCIFKRDIAEEPRAVRRRIGILPENYDVYDGMTGKEHVRAILRLKNADDDPNDLLETVGLTSEAFDRPAGGYSKGMQQRLALAMALAGDPDLLVLDEPSSGLDPNGIALIRELVSKAAADGTTVFFSSHRLTEVEAVCDRVGIMNDGRLVSIKAVDGLAERTGGTERLRLFTEEPPDSDLLDSLRTDEGIAEVCHDERILTVNCTTPAAKADVVERINRACSVHDFEVDETALEDVFDTIIEGDQFDTTRTGTKADATTGRSK